MPSTSTRKNLELDLKVGIFVSLGVTLVMLAIILLDGGGSFFTKNNRYSIHFPSIDGLVIGAKVAVGGLNVGTVDKVDYDPQTKDIRVDVLINSKYGDLVRSDSQAELMTQGMLGDKYLSINAGAAEQEVIKNGATIPHKPTRDFNQFISKGDQLLISLNSIAQTMDRLLKTMESGNKSEQIFQNVLTTSKNLSVASTKLTQEIEQIRFKKSFDHLESILSKINNGTGTIGALVNDPGLYYDAKALLGNANRNKVVRNLVRKTIRDSEETETAADSSTDSKTQKQK